eukprot:TRINITY_DN9892_c0_g2_i1.p1 TRINITY_DN9892_c0_g2~~TRINITY_DN9892_c0_g2_i1.p1  ORF type:complete len:119 (+),score=19.54 TRINITY_DN9892_c0_g2_i1:192-548(+)
MGRICKASATMILWHSSSSSSSCTAAAAYCAGAACVDFKINIASAQCTSGVGLLECSIKHAILALKLPSATTVQLSSGLCLLICIEGGPCMHRLKLMPGIPLQRQWLAVPSSALWSKL